MNASCFSSVQSSQKNAPLVESIITVPSFWLFVCPVQQVVNDINRALNNSDMDALQKGLGSSAAGLSGVNSEHGRWYLQTLLEQKRLKQEVRGHGLQ